MRKFSGECSINSHIADPDGIEISVVVPLFNKSKYIERTISSVLSQTVKNFEIVIVDDGSRDDGATIVSNIDDPRIRLLRQDNQGVSAARNRGIREALSPLVAFLDADDEWAPDHLATLLDLSRRYPGAGAYATAYTHVFREGQPSLAKFAAIPSAPWEGVIPDYFKSAVYGDPPIWSSSVAVPKKVFETIGVFKPGERLGEDLDMWGRIAIEYKIAFSWNGMAFYREDSDGRVCEMNCIEKQLPFVDTVDNLPENKKITFYADLYVSEMKIKHICSLIFSGRKMEALKLLRKIKIPKTRLFSLVKVLVFMLMPLAVVIKIRQLRLKTRHRSSF